MSPLLWCLIVDDQVTRLSRGRVYPQGYADDTEPSSSVEIPRTRCRSSYSGPSTPQPLGAARSMSLNPEVNEPILTMKRNLPDFFAPVFFEVTLHRSQPVSISG
jgi:hypothetical protein